MRIRDYLCRAASQWTASLILLLALVTIEFVWLRSTGDVRGNIALLLPVCWLNAAIGWLELGAPALLICLPVAFISRSGRTTNPDRPVTFAPGSPGPADHVFRQSLRAAGRRPLRLFLDRDPPDRRRLGRPLLDRGCDRRGSVGRSRLVAASNRPTTGEPLAVRLGGIDRRNFIVIRFAGCERR